MTGKVRDDADFEQDLSRVLVDSLAADCALHSQRWIDAFRAVPRHLFVPQVFLDRNHDGAYELLDSHDPHRRGDWLEQVYADEPLVTQVEGDVLLSSSSQPSLMAMMAEALSVTASERVLEIGTGTGYNTALLCEALGSEQVTSVDIDAGLTRAARVRLRDLGYSPTIVTADGAAGYPEGAPFDRVIATCAMPRIPPAWITQTSPGGLILASLYRELGGGPLALLTAAGDHASGHFLPFSAGFMPTREHRRVSAVDLLETITESPEPQRSTPMNAGALDDDAFGMFAALRLSGVQRLGLLPDGEPEQAWLLGDDGSWACQLGQAGPVTQGGPARLWDRLEGAYRDWTALGSPPRQALGLTVTADGTHQLWHQAPDGPGWTL